MVDLCHPRPSPTTRMAPCPGYASFSLEYAIWLELARVNLSRVQIIHTPFFSASSLSIFLLESHAMHPTT